MTGRSQERSADRRDDDQGRRAAARVDIAKAAFGPARRSSVAKTSTPMQVTRRIGR